MSTQFQSTITGVVLAGGRGRRMDGQDKGLVQLNQHTLIEQVVARLQPQVRKVLINANRNQAQYTALTGCPVVNDDFGNYAGPLAGMLAGLQAAETELVAFVPCDSPYLPTDLISRLYQDLQQQNAEISVVHDGQRLQPVFVLMQQALHTDLIQALQQGERKIDRWYAQHRLVQSDCADVAHQLINVNTPDELAQLQTQPPQVG